MLKFFKKENPDKKNDKNTLLETASLLIHAAKIDENYTEKEKLIIEKALIELGSNRENIKETIKIAEENEKNSNQILDFTKSIKTMDETYKTKIIETLWKIIYSDNASDMFESNLMRRLAGLLYLDNKTVGNIKEKIKKSLSK